MARNFTVQQMITAVRSRADIVTDGHITDAEIMVWLSQWYAELYDILVSSGIAYFETSSAFPATDGVSSTLALPADFYGLVRLDYNYTPEIDLQVVEITPRALHRVAKTGDRAYYYRVVGSNIVLYPRPKAGQVYTLKYIPAAADLTSTAQTVDGVSGWEDYVITGAVIYALKKQDRPNQDEWKRIRELEDRITKAAQNRAIASATSLVSSDDDVWSDADPADWKL